jgi:hypothetical protein
MIITLHLKIFVTIALSLSMVTEDQLTEYARIQI